MGNKRNHQPRNKKTNNWKVVKRIRYEKKLNAESVPFSEFPVECLNVADVGATSEEAFTVESNEHEVLADENIAHAIKRKRVSCVEFENEAPPLLSDHACLSEAEDVDEENRTTNDPPSMDKEPYNEERFDDEPYDEEPYDDEPYDAESGDEDRNDEENSEDEHSDVDHRDNNENDSEEGIGGQDDSSDNTGSDDEEVIKEQKVTGRRLFEVADLFVRLKKMGSHSQNCSYEDMILVGETKKGFNAIFKFRCEKCGSRRKLESCPKKEKSLNCNEEAVLGINSIGSGFYHLQELFSNLNVPCMGDTLYNSISKRQQSDWMSLAKEWSLKALYEEMELARAAGDVDANGNVLIAVIADGGWGKRSYGKAFNSLSGCAVLIGLRTKKIVFFGVRNKYCHTCKIAQSQCTPVKEHDCNINYHGPSSGMEADIILEGFRTSEQHGARFHKLIADGDSSTYKILRDQRIYKNPDLVIEKLECVNHLFRNFRSKFVFIAKVTKFNSTLRKQIKKCKGNDICKGVKVAAKYWRETNLSLREKIRNLEDDIMNAPLHYFAVHSKCKPYFCTKVTSQAALDNLQLLKDDGLFYEIMNLCQVYFGGNAKSLLINETNNPAEEFNNLVAKYVGGKRINYSSAKSYSARVAIAVVQYNSDGHAGSEFRKFKIGGDHDSFTKKLEVVRKRKVKYNAVIQETKKRSRHQTEDISSPAYSHGSEFETVDKPPEVFEKCKDIFMAKIKHNQKNRKRIEKDTKDKQYDSYFHTIRQDLLPSSFFHRIAKSNMKQGLVAILNEILYARTEFGNNAAIKHQRLVERDALRVFTDLFEDQAVKECGLFIDREHAFLCSSPFRLVGNESILSVKCPVKQYNKDFESARKNIPFFKKTGDGFTINENSDWYIEIQSEMHITKKNHAYLI